MRGKSKQVINDLLRQALGISHRRDVELPVFHMGSLPGIDQVGYNKLAEELAFAEESKKVQG